MLLGRQAFEEDNEGRIIRSEVWGEDIFGWKDSIEKGTEKIKRNAISSAIWRSVKVSPHFHILIERNKIFFQIEIRT